MDAAWGVLLLVVGLLVSVALHELGHMIPAKMFGVRVSQYFVGFGPTVWSVTKGETEYGIKALPLGGFVRLVGMVPPASRVKPLRVRGWARDVIEDARESSEAEVAGDDARAFYRLVWWRKAIVMFGGPFTNLVLAVLIFTVVTSGFGVLSQTLTVDTVIACVPVQGTIECAADGQASPASAAGIEKGDTFVSIDGQELESWAQLTAYVAARPGEALDVVMMRDGAERHVSLTPAERTRESATQAGQMETVGFMGVTSELQRTRQPLATGVVMAWDGSVQTIEVIGRLPVELYHVARATLGLEERSSASVMGLIGVGRAAGEVASADAAGYSALDRASDMLMLIGGLNLALFAFNLIPLTPLDGGHIVSALWQGIRDAWARVRRAPQPFLVDVARQVPFAYAVFGILILMSVVLAIADVVAPIELT